MRATVQTAGIRAGRLPDPGTVAGVELIIVCGVAGALDPELITGEVILDDPHLHIPDSPLYRRGRIHTASQIVSTPADKARLYAETNALAVDMEQAIVLDFAKKHGIAMIGMRAISDTADRSLDAAVVHLVDDLGRPRPLKIASILLRRPLLTRHLMRLNSDSKIALKNLGTALRSVIENLTETGDRAITPS